MRIDLSLQDVHGWCPITQDDLILRCPRGYKFLENVKFELFVVLREEQSFELASVEVFLGHRYSCSSALVAVGRGSNRALGFLFQEFLLDYLSIELSFRSHLDRAVS